MNPSLFSTPADLRAAPLAGLVRHLGHVLGRFRRGNGGTVAVFFAAAMIPFIGIAGAAVDYSRATNNRASLQLALDAAILAGAKDGSGSWTTVAGKTFSDIYTPKSGSAPTPSFSFASGTYAAQVDAAIPTAFMKLLGQPSIAVSVSSSATLSGGEKDDSCLLTLDAGSPSSTVSLRFNGAPNVNLTGCVMRSNTSMTCNGHGGGASAAIAAGTSSGCSNPQSGASKVVDIYKPVAANITRRCSSYPGATWIPGSPPPAPKMLTVAYPGFTGYHVCGDLTLSGSGWLTGASPAGETVIFVENGKIILDGNAAVSAMKTTFVMTGDNSVAVGLEFPNGAGHGARLTVSPPVSGANPFAGISIFKDPALTNGVDEDWGPGATVNSEAVVYMPNTNLTIRGNSGSSSTTACSKIVVKTLTVNGSVTLNHNAAACAALGVKQWAGAGSPYITR